MSEEREVVEIARNDLAMRIATDALDDTEAADWLVPWFGNENTDLGQAVARLITAARADERGRHATPLIESNSNAH